MKTPEFWATAMCPTSNWAVTVQKRSLYEALLELPHSGPDAPGSAGALSELEVSDAHFSKNFSLVIYPQIDACRSATLCTRDGGARNSGGVRGRRRSAGHDFRRLRNNAYGNGACFREGEWKQDHHHPRAVNGRDSGGHPQPAAARRSRRYSHHGQQRP